MKYKLHSRGRIPYRGEPIPHEPRPPKRFRNRKLENIQIRKTILIICGFFLLISLGLFTFLGNINKTLAIATFIFIFFIGALFTGMTADALYSIDKFCPHYDVDISEKEPEEYKHHSRDYHDLNN